MSYMLTRLTASHVRAAPDTQGWNSKTVFDWMLLSLLLVNPVHMDELAATGLMYTYLFQRLPPTLGSVIKHS